MRRLTPLLALLSLPAGACGGAPASPCEISSYPQGGRYCNSAIVLAARASTTIQVPQDDVDQIYETLRPAWVSVPETRLAKAQNRLLSGPTDVSVLSEWPAIVAAWGHDQIDSGDALVDSVFAENGATEVHSSGVDYVVHFRVPISVRALAVAASAIPNTSISTEMYVMQGADIDDIVWRADGATATFRYGWGDCFVQCDGTHYWTVDLPDVGTAALVAEGGDPLPADVLAYAATLPSP